MSTFVSTFHCMRACMRGCAGTGDLCGNAVVSGGTLSPASGHDDDLAVATQAEAGSPAAVAHG